MIVSMGVAKLPRKSARASPPRPLSEPPVPLLRLKQGNEGVDVKEGCLDTVIEYNNIAMQNDPHSAGLAFAYCFVVLGTMIGL